MPILLFLLWPRHAQAQTATFTPSPTPSSTPTRTPPPTIARITLPTSTPSKTPTITPTPPTATPTPTTYLFSGNPVPGPTAGPLWDPLCALWSVSNLFDHRYPLLRLACDIITPLDLGCKNIFDTQEFGPLLMDYSGSYASLPFDGSSLVTISAPAERAMSQGIGLNKWTNAMVKAPIGGALIVRPLDAGARTDACPADIEEPGAEATIFYKHDLPGGWSGGHSRRLDIAPISSFQPMGVYAVKPGEPIGITFTDLSFEILYGDFDRTADPLGWDMDHTGRHSQPLPIHLDPYARMMAEWVDEDISEWASVRLIPPRHLDMKGCFQDCPGGIDNSYIVDDGDDGFECFLCTACVDPLREWDGDCMTLPLTSGGELGAAVYIFDAPPGTYTVSAYVPYGGLENVTFANYSIYSLDPLGNEDELASIQGQQSFSGWNTLGQLYFSGQPMVIVSGDNPWDLGVDCWDIGVDAIALTPICQPRQGRPIRRPPPLPTIVTRATPCATFPCGGQ